jgi:hypothetical protein
MAVLWQRKIAPGVALCFQRYQCNSFDNSRKQPTVLGHKPEPLRGNRFYPTPPTFNNCRVSNQSVSQPSVEDPPSTD